MPTPGRHDHDHWHMQREDDVLTLSGPDFRAGTGRSQKIVWRRAP